MSIKKSLFDALKFGFYIIWFFVLSFFILALYFLTIDIKGGIITLFFALLLNIPFIVIWKKYYYFGFSDIYRHVRQLIKEIIEFGKGIAYLIILIIVLIILWNFGKGSINFIGNLFKDDSWTLMVCKTKLNESECFDNDYVIPGFNSQKECMLEGAKNFDRQGFECGRGCREEYSLRVCDVICNKAGCSDDKTSFPL